MSSARLSVTFALALATNVVFAEHVAAEQASSQQTFSGELWRLDNNAGYMIDGCLLKDAIANKVMKFCSVGQQCEITGIIEHCRGVRGACIEMTRLMSARWAKNLPICAPSAAADRANQWWSNNASVIVRGTIRESKNAIPYGHMEIVLDLTTCSSGAPMAVVRVAEKWIGHYVELNGTAMKEGDVWYIIARAVKDVEP
jgi:hypothetical protein